MFREHNDSKVLLNVNLLTSHGFCSRIHAPRSRPFPRIPPNPAELFRQWISQGVVPGQTDGAPSASLFDHTLSFWTERRRANVLLVHFDDLKADLDGEMRRIAAFLDIDVDPGKWPALVEAATFASMRDRGEILMPQFNTTNLTGGAKRLFHKGSSGRWKDVLTDDDLRLYDAKLREKFPPDVAVWMEGGRRRTGDPANL